MNSSATQQIIIGTVLAVVVVVLVLLLVRPWNKGKKGECQRDRQKHKKKVKMDESKNQVAPQSSQDPFALKSSSAAKPSDDAETPEDENMSAREKYMARINARKTHGRKAYEEDETTKGDMRAHYMALRRGPSSSARRSRHMSTAAEMMSRATFTSGGKSHRDGITSSFDRNRMSAQQFRQ